MTKSKSEENQNQSNVSKKFDYVSNNEKKSNQKEEFDFDKSSLINLSKNSSENKFYISQEINKGPWTQRENKILVEYVKKFGPKKWNQCAEFIKNRTGKQCREHWKNCLNPEIKKGNWRLDEDLFIMIFYQKCNGSWKEMIHLFEDRTENSIKNRFFSQLRKIAANDLENFNKKRSTKMDLKNLVKYLEQGIEEAKSNFMTKNKMNEDEFKNYLKKIEIKLNNKKKEKKRKRNKIHKKIIINNNSRNLLGKKREKFSPEKKEEIKNEEEMANIIKNIKAESNESTKITDLTNQIINKEKNKENIEKSNENKIRENNQELNESEESFENYYNDNNKFLEINEMDLGNILNNSFNSLDSKEDDEKIEESLGNPDGFSQEFFQSYEPEKIKRTNSEIFSRITDSYFFPFGKR